MSLLQNEQLLRLRAMVLSIADRLSWLGPLLARLTVGIVFAQSGWGKLGNLEKVTEFFTSLGIPMPAANAAFVATVELVGGTCLIIGLLSRVMSLPLIGTMVVAIATAQWEEVEGIGGFVGLSEWDYIVLLTWIAIAGPGRASIDHMLARQMDAKR
jgi:putative oxidoreductase